MRLMKLPDHKRVVTIEPELFSKGWVYAAEDARRQFLIVSQRVKFLQRTIAHECGEQCSMASLFESATDKLKTKGGRTQSFRVRRMEAADLPSYLEEARPLYSKVLIAAVNPSKWHLA